LCSFSVPVGNNFILLVSPLGHLCALNMLVFLSVSQQVLVAKVCSDELFCCVIFGVSHMTKDTNSLWCHSVAFILLIGELHTLVSETVAGCFTDVFILVTLILIFLPLLLSDPRDMVYLECIFRASAHLMKSSCSAGKIYFSLILSCALN